MFGSSSWSGNLKPGGANGSEDLVNQQNPTFLQQGSMVDYSSLVQNMKEKDQTSTFADPSNGEMGRRPAGDEDELNCAEEGADGDDNSEAGQGKKESYWLRVKWTDVMVKLLLTAVSYIVEDCSDVFGGERRKATLLQKKGKWKIISKVMGERGIHVSPRQCEDKFHELNKRYKKLDKILGIGNSSKVVKNPGLLDTMDLSEKEKEEVRKILSSKHLFYEVLCSFHNGDRLFLPHDPDLRRSLHLTLESKDDLHDKNMEFDEGDQNAEADKQVDGTADSGKLMEVSAKRLKQRDANEDDCDRGLEARNDFTDVHLEDNSAEGSKAEEAWKEWLACRSLQLEEQKVHIETEMLKLEKERFKWQKMNWEQERELKKKKMENEYMKLQNERMALIIKSKKMGAG